MKIKALLATIISAVALQGVIAGEWCPPACEDKCPVECCPDQNGSVSVGYETDYIFYGVRLARDSVWADVNYTFDICCLPVTIGAWHLSSLGSGLPNADGFGDETDLYVNVGLPSICGFDLNLGYTHYMYPTTRLPQGAAGPLVGDSTNELSLTISREIWCGLNLTYRAAHDFNMPSAGSTGVEPQNNTDDGAWVQTIGLDKTFDINDCIALDLSAGVLHTDNYWTNLQNAQAGNTRNSGWNSYYIQAALPVSIGCNATLTPYVGYNGSPDGWITDGLNGINHPGNTGANANDVLHGGVSISVGF